MSVYIKDISMPTNCWECHFGHGDTGVCVVDFKQHGDWNEPQNCPLVNVPPHGRLIDADALEELVINQKYACARASASGAITELHKSWGLHDAELMIEATPTIIPEEEGEG